MLEDLYRMVTHLHCSLIGMMVITCSACTVSCVAFQAAKLEEDFADAVGLLLDLLLAYKVRN